VKDHAKNTATKFGFNRSGNETAAPAETKRRPIFTVENIERVKKKDGCG
jgi:hypothetical protein